MKSAQLEQGERQADIVVEIANRGQHCVGAARCRAQDAGQHLLHRGLAVAAGYRHYWNSELGAPMRRQPPQREAGVFYNQERELRTED